MPSTTSLRAERRIVSDMDAAQELFWREGWTDGLPIVPPTFESCCPTRELSSTIVAQPPTIRQQNWSVLGTSRQLGGAATRPELALLRSSDPLD